MGYIYLSDSRPDADDSDNNYLYFNESNPHSVAEIELLLSSKRKRDSSFFRELEMLCKSSWLPKRNQNNFIEKFSSFTKSIFKGLRRKKLFLLWKNMA